MILSLCKITNTHLGPTYSWHLELHSTSSFQCNPALSLTRHVDLLKLDNSHMIVIPISSPLVFHLYVRLVCSVSWTLLEIGV